MDFYSELVQIDATGTAEALLGEKNVNFSSQAELAEILDPAYDHSRDTFVYDEYWPGIVAVDLTPDGDGTPAGTRQMRVAMTSFTGGLGGPLPGGFIPLFQATTEGSTLYFFGVIQSGSEPNGEFEHIETRGPCPEPSSLLLTGLGACAAVVSSRRRRQELSR